MTKKITVAAFRQMEFDDDENFYYELINGEIVKKSAPSPLHQRISWKLEKKIGFFIEEHQLGELYHAPIDVLFDEFNQFQPDIIFIATASAGLVDDHEGILGAPELVVEIISPGSVIRDRVEKKGVFEKTGVREYWVVDPNNRTVEVYNCTGKVFDLKSFAEISGKVSSEVLKGFELDIADVFG